MCVPACVCAFQMKEVLDLGGINSFMTSLQDLVYGVADPHETEEQTAKRAERRKIYPEKLLVCNITSNVTHWSSNAFFKFLLLLFAFTVSIQSVWLVCKTCVCCVFIDAVC